MGQSKDVQVSYLLHKPREQNCRNLYIVHLYIATLEFIIKLFVLCLTETFVILLQNYRIFQNTR
jgi:hypothetical protein